MPDVMNPNCPSRDVLRRIGERWAPLIVEALHEGPLRFTTLRRRIGGVMPKVLTQTLRSLEQDGLVSRRTYAEMPPRVEYRLTALGISLLEPIAANRRWAEAHVDDIIAARARWHDALSPGEQA